MTAHDHNKTLITIFSTFGAIWALVLLAGPWIVGLAISRRQERIWAGIFLFGFVPLITLLYCSTAIAMHRRKAVGRKLALISAATLIMFWPLVSYVWWFMHSDDAKQMYGVERE